jgi:hypothetical protein
MAVDSIRSSFTGTAETPAAVLSKHISLKYDDDFSKARVQPHLVLKHTPLWEDCHDFTQSTAKQAFKIVRETHDFKLTDKDSRDWDTTLATRLRAEGKHTNSAQIRNINTKWLRNFSCLRWKSFVAIITEVSRAFIRVELCVAIPSQQGTR